MLGLQAFELEDRPLAEKLLDQLGLADSASAIDGDHRSFSLGIDFLKPQPIGLSACVRPEFGRNFCRIPMRFVAP